MREYIARLIDCGMPRDVAVAVCRSFAKDDDWYGMAQYVNYVEEETREGDEEQW